MPCTRVHLSVSSAKLNLTSLRDSNNTRNCVVSWIDRISLASFSFFFFFFSFFFKNRISLRTSQGRESRLERSTATISSIIFPWKSNDRSPPPPVIYIIFEISALAVKKRWSRTEGYELRPSWKRSKKCSQKIGGEWCVETRSIDYIYIYMY